MPQVILSPKALRDLERLRVFLQSKNPQAAKNAVSAIREALQTLRVAPLAHTPDPEDPNYRTMQIPFGSSGYTLWYHYKRCENIIVLSLKHQKEENYKNDF